MNTENTAAKLDFRSMYDFIGSGLFADNKFCSVLLIEDDKDYAELLKMQLERNSGIRVKLAIDPYEATDFLTERCYDLVIADWALPPFNASSAIQQADRFLKMDPLLPLKWTKKRVPVVLISGEDHSKDLKGVKSLEHFEFVQFLLKQTGMRKIVKRIKKMLGQKRINGPRFALSPTIH